MNTDHEMAISPLERSLSNFDNSKAVTVEDRLSSASGMKPGAWRADRPTVVLVAPNVSRNMGGEALKALHIWRALEENDIHCVQVTHERVRSEIVAEPVRGHVVYVQDHPFHLLLMRLRLWAPFNVVGAWLLHKAACKAAQDNGAWLVHYTAPISPVLPYFRVSQCPTVIGPINGNIPYPPPLRELEPGIARFRRFIAPLAQAIMGVLFSGKRRAARILVAGGERTRIALKRGLVSDARFIDTLDSGVDDALSSRRAFTHSGECKRFVFIGRLVPYKGCSIAIRAIAMTEDCTLDIIGDGTERAELEQLARNLGVESRIRFLGWLPAGEAVFAALEGYRAMVSPTMAEANGIVVQEAMMLGLPVITLNWGGPQLLLDADTGILIDPAPVDQLVASFAAEMSALSQDGARANQLASNARRSAEEQGFAWSGLIVRWIKMYNEVLEPSELQIPVAAE